MRKLILGVGMVALAGCGGPSAKYRIDDSTLAAVPMQEKQSIFAAQNELNQAKAEQQQASAQLKQIETDLDVADNEYKTAKLNRDTAKLNAQAAEQSGDINRKNAAQRDQNVAELGVKAADAKVDWLSKKRKWFKRQVDAAEAHVGAADSRTELEKAKLAQSKGIRPSEKFDVMNFETDNMDKQKSYGDAKMDADKLQAEVANLERTYQVQQQQYDQAKSAAAAGH